MFEQTKSLFSLLENILTIFILVLPYVLNSGNVLNSGSVLYKSLFVIIIVWSRCCVVGVDNDGRVNLSLRESHLGEKVTDVRDPEITSFSDLKIGKTVRGYVKSKTDVGYFIRLTK